MSVSNSSYRKRMEKHCVRNRKNLVGRLEHPRTVTWQALVSVKGNGLLKSTIFATMFGRVKNHAFC